MVAPSFQVRVARLIRGQSTRNRIVVPAPIHSDDQLLGLGRSHPLDLPVLAKDICLLPTSVWLRIFRISFDQSDRSLVWKRSRAFASLIATPHIQHEKGLRFLADPSCIFTLTIERLLRFDNCCHIDGVITKVGRDLIDQVGWSIFFQDRDAGQHFPLVYHLLCYIESS